MHPPRTQAMRTIAHRHRPKRIDLHFVLVAVAVLVAFAARIIPALDASRPIVFEDEIGYLANARALAGAGEAGLGQMGYYEAGWSLFLVPIYWLTSDPSHIYRAAICMSVLAGWAILWPVAGIIRQTSGLPRGKSIVMGALASMVPGSVLMSGYVYSEAMIGLVLSTLLWLAFKVWSDSSALKIACFGALAAFAPMVHGRALALPIIAVAFLIAAGLAKKVRWWTVALSVMALGAVALIHNSVDVYLKSTIYDLAFDRLSRGISGLASGGVRGFAALLFGQLWYLTATTAGLSLIGLGVVIRRALRELRSRILGPWVFTMLVTGSVLGISVLNFMGAFPDPKRLDYFSYGRYLDSMAPVLVGFGLTWLLTARHHAWGLASVAGACLGLGAGMTVLDGGFSSLIGKPIAALSVSGMAWAIDPEVAALPLITVTSAALAIIALMAAGRRYVVVRFLVLTVAAVAAITIGEFRTMRVLDKPWANLLTMQSALASLSPKTIAYSTNAASLYGRNGYQFYTPTTHFLFFDGDKENPPAEIVLARQDWQSAKKLGARMMMADTHINQAIWILPGVLQNNLEAKGRLLPRTHSDVLPASSKTYRIGLGKNGIVGAEFDLLGVQVVHLELQSTGRGAPWESFNSRVGDKFGTVRIVADWTCDGPMTTHMTELPRSMFPGESISVDLPLDKKWMGSAASCKVSVGLLEEGVGRFPEADPVSFAVRRVD